MEENKKIIHLCDWAGQPHIHILCDNRWTTPAWIEHYVSEMDLGIPGGPYLDDDGHFYDFDESKVTCSDCLKKISKEEKDKH